jgi:NAD(P)-dependent dehydrogenase (short-subunit alcohol dehydrogenase family)
MSASFDLQGEVALVTGASGGLGEHMARTLAKAGAKVALAARRVDRLTSLAEEIEKTGGRALPVACDVTSPESISEAVEAAETELGPIGILVNNSGISGAKRTAELSETDWDSVLDTNLKGAFFMAQAVSNRLIALGRGGRIVNIASITGLRPIGAVAAYAASKAGMIHLTRVMAMELARHAIQVNAIAPGYVETDFNRDFLRSPAGEKLRGRIPFGRFGQPEELDGALLLLCSDAGRYITGITIPIDGGHLASSL